MNGNVRRWAWFFDLQTPGPDSERAVTVPPTTERQRQSPVLAGGFQGRLPVLGVILLLVVAVLVHPSAAPSHAVDGEPAQFSAAQVRLFDQEELRGGGTLVDRNWVLTAVLAVNEPTDPTGLTIRFGVVDNSRDEQDRANVRQIDRIVTPPEGGLAMLHFADPVPENMVLRSLATRPPDRFSPAFEFGWGSERRSGTTLRMARTIVYDPVAEANAADLRETVEDFEENFPTGIQPMVLSLLTYSHDLGSGVFAPGGILIGVDSFNVRYRHVNATGNLFGDPVPASYDQPVWAYRQWILDTINGAGSSGGGGNPGGPPRRRLPETAPAGDLPMTLPPQTRSCTPAAASCLVSDPGWRQGVILGAGNHRGTALARCAATDACSFDGTPYPAGARARMRLGSASAPDAPGTRQVMVWCKTTTAFPDPTSPTQPVLRVSFTNAEPDGTLLGYGWWDVTPDQIGTGTDKAPLDTGGLAPC